MSDIPAFLRRHGVAEVTDNVPPGYRVQAPSLALVTLLRSELTAHLARVAADRARERGTGDD